MSTGCLTDRRILVTGGAGFIGSHLSDALVDDNDVRVIDNLTSGERSTLPDDVTFVHGDIRDEDTLSQLVADVDVVFHEAALVSVQHSIEDPVESHETNTRATLGLLEAARANDVRVVLASSAAIYGHPESVPISETARKEPTSPYGLDKLAIDHYARLYANLYDVETIPLRYFNVYGPGQVAGDYSGVISVFIEQALSGENITVHGDGDQTRDFVYIDDVVRANCAAATTDVVGQAYNVGTGESISVRELAEEIQDITDTCSDIVHTDARSGDIAHSQADISRMRDQLGVEPTVSLREGLEYTVEWYRESRL
ncbi:NAD-dependent epimerase/dehydratase family protein [Halobaculum gomorrense]|uniref:UDP-glucose 4-epimerase n=1 Tax=Halobaculum gomorrense TaxID=43928 RepID=A0A1M5JCN2_9EURY|nr:UDP-glucose 4-epimerase [Halobaculum gomorrense]